MKSSALFASALVGSILFCTSAGLAQTSESDKIKHSILSLDSLLFEVGFNNCRIEVFEELTADDFEFYHDKSGPQNKSEFLTGLQSGLCADVKNYQSTRVLDPQFNRVHLLYDNGILYGALQTGVHSFYETIPGQEPLFGSTAQFSHYWEWIEGRWQLKRVFSFDHRS